MKALVMVAPTVHEGTRDKVRAALRDRFAAAGFAHEWAETPAADAVPEFVRGRLRGGADCVVAVGGDGTVSAVAHALVDGPVPLGIVPAGTGNLVARELGIPLDVEAAVGVLAGSRNTRKLDAMRVGGHTYLLNAGVGINAEVIRRTSRLGKSLFGLSAYVGTAVWKVLQARPQRLEVTVDGATRVYEATDVLISNFGALARGLHPNGPDIRVDDGLINVCIICMKMPLEYPWYYVLKSLRLKHADRIIHEFEAKQSVTLRSDVPLAVQADGDMIGTTPVTIDVLPRALTVIVP